MTLLKRRIVLTLTLLISASTFLPAVFVAHAEPLKVCATVTDLGGLAREIGGEQVQVTIFAKGTEDAHFVEARPSFIRELNRADVYLQMGLEFEGAWAPLVLRGARNARVQPGAPGFIDVARAIDPIGVPTGPIDRSLGDVHAFGNPHFLLDPVNGLKVGRLIRDRFSTLRPEHRDYFHQRYEDFAARLGAALVGEDLAAQYDVEQLMTLHEHDRLDAFLAQQGQADLLGGWIGRLRAYRDRPIVTDHASWDYFARRFRLNVVAYMEPRPGIPPSVRHLTQVVQLINDRDVRVAVMSPYFPPRHGAFLAENTRATAVVLAHQVQALPEAGDYLGLFEGNVERLVRAFEKESSP